MATRASMAAGVAVTGILFAARLASAGTVGGDDSAAVSLLRGQLNSTLGTLSAANAAAQSLGGTGASMWVSTASGSGSILGGAGSPGDAAWAQTALLVNDLAKSFGGGTSSRILMQRSEDKYYTGVEGVGGNWFATAAAAQAYLFTLLLSDNVAAPPQVRTAVQTATAPDINTAVEAATTALQDTRKLASAGASATLTLSSAKFAAIDLPSVYAGAAVRVAKVERLTPTDVAVTFDIPAGIAQGSLPVRAYKPNTSFVALDTFEIFVSGVGSGVAAPADDHGGTNATATIVAGTNDGEIGASGDEDVFQADLSAKGMLTLTTTGTTDVVVLLQDAGGATLASDDDSGGWYNAKLVRQVNAGTYFVRVRHAAGGTGRYTLKSDFVPN